MKQLLTITIIFLSFQTLPAIANKKVENLAKYFVQHFKDGNSFLLDTNLFTDHCIKKRNLDSLKLKKFNKKFDSLDQSKNTLKYSISGYLPSFDPNYPPGDYYIVYVDPPSQKIILYIMINFKDNKYQINDYYFPDLTSIHPVIDD